MLNIQIRPITKWPGTENKTAYRKAAQKLHPDNGGKSEEFVKLAEANKVLAARA